MGFIVAVVREGHFHGMTENKVAKEIMLTNKWGHVEIFDTIEAAEAAALNARNRWRNMNADYARLAAARKGSDEDFLPGIEAASPTPAQYRVYPLGEPLDRQFTE